MTTRLCIRCGQMPANVPHSIILCKLCFDMSVRVSERLHREPDDKLVNKAHVEEPDNDE